MHVSPISMIVAVAADLELPPQQSDMFGHRASSQTVCRLRPRKSAFIFLYDGPSGIGVFSHKGNLVISFFLPLGPTNAVFNVYASDGGRGPLPETKSVNDGPAFSLSAKVVGRTWGLAEGDSVIFGSGAAVANGRGEMVLKDGGRKTRNGEDVILPRRQRNLGVAPGMAKSQ